MIRMLLLSYCYGIRHERRLCQEVTLHLAYRWFCKLDLDDKVPHHSTFSDANARINHSRIERLAIWETQNPEYPADLPDAGESATILRVPLS
jgi:transposase